MKITKVRFLEVRGTMEYEGPMGEERLVRPVDIYPEFRAQPSYGLPSTTEGGRYAMRALYLLIDTDTDVTGIWGPVGDELARIGPENLPGVLRRMAQPSLA